MNLTDLEALEARLIALQQQQYGINASLILACPSPRFFFIEGNNTVHKMHNLRTGVGGSYGEALFRQIGPAYKDAADSFPPASLKA